MPERPTPQELRHLLKALRTRDITGLNLKERRLLVYTLLREEGVPEHLAWTCTWMPMEKLRKRGYTGKAR